MLKKEEQAIEIISFLVTSYRKAINHQGDPEPISKIISAYCDALKEYGKMTEEELHILYLKGKIKADEDQLQRHKNEVKELLKGDDK